MIEKVLKVYYYYYISLKYLLKSLVYLIWKDEAVPWQFVRRRRFLRDCHRRTECKTDPVPFKVFLLDWSYILMKRSASNPKSNTKEFSYDGNFLFFWAGTPQISWALERLRGKQGNSRAIYQPKNKPLVTFIHRIHFSNTNTFISSI